MSSQSNRKKRLGSRRMAPHLKETSIPDNSGVDNMSVNQQQIPEESAQSLVGFSADSSKSEIQHPPPHEVSNRRKLGSTRKSKGRQYVKGPETELPYEPQENAEQETKNNTTLETQMSTAAQLETPDDLNWGREHALPDPTTTFCLADVMESLIPEVDNMKACADETKLKGDEKYDTLVREEIKENAHTFDLSELTRVSLPSCPSLDQQIINSQAANSNVCLLAESVTPTKDDSDLFRQDGSLQGSYWVDESHVKSVVLETMTTEKATNESNPKEKNEIEFSVEQAAVCLPKEEFPTNEEHRDLFKLSEVTDAQYLKYAVNKAHEKNDKTIHLQDSHQSDVSSVIHGKEQTDTCSENQGHEINNTDQSELMVESSDSAIKKEVSALDEKQKKCPTRKGKFEALEEKNADDDAHHSKKTGITGVERAERTVGQLCEDEGLVENEAKHSHEQSVQEVEEAVSKVKKSNFSPPTQMPNLDTLLDSQLQDSSVSMDEQTNADFSLTGKRRKLGSSRKIKGRYAVKKTEEEILGTSGDEETLEITKIPLACQEKLNQDPEHDILSMSHDNSLFSESAAGYSEVRVSRPTEYPEADLESVILKGEKSPENQEERETENNLQVADNSVNISLQEDAEYESCQSKEVKSAPVLEDAVQEQQEDAVHSTQNILQTNDMCETVEAKEDCLATCGDQIDQDEIINTDLPEYTISNTDDSAAKQEVSKMDNITDVYPTKENISEALHPGNEHYDFYDANKPHLCDTGNADSVPRHEHEFMARGEDDLKPDTDQIFNLEKEGLLSEVGENNSALSTFHSQSIVSSLAQPQERSLSFDEEHNMGFPHSGRRKKLGSSRKNKGKHKVKNMVIETCYKGADDNADSNEPSETTSTAETVCQEISIEIMEGEQEKDILQTEEANAHTGSLVSTSELTIFGAHSASMIDQKVIYESCYREMSDEELPNVPSPTGTEKRVTDKSTDLFLQDENYQQDHLLCEPHVCPITPEMQTEKSSSIKYTGRGERDENTSPEGELATKEEQLSNVRVTRHSGDAVTNAHGQEIEPAQMQGMSETDCTAEKKMGDATENTEILSRNSYDQTETGDIYQPDIAVNSVEDPQAQVRDSERVDTALGDAHEIKEQEKDDVNPSAEETAHQVREGLFSEIGDDETSLQSLQYEIQAPSDSQPQQDDTSSYQEKSLEIKLEEPDKTDPIHTESISVNDKQNANFFTVAGITDFTMSSSHPSPTAKLQLKESYSGDLSDDRLPTVSTVTENKERDEDTEKSYGNSQEKKLSSENEENACTTERTTEKSNPEHQTEFEYIGEQRLSSLQEKCLKTVEQGELFNSYEAAQAEDSENVGSEASEEQIVSVQNQKMPQVDHISVPESSCSLQTLQSCTDDSLDPKLLDSLWSTKNETQSALKPAGNRRKLGSSQRKKRTVDVEGPEASQKPTDGVLDNTEHDEAGKLATKQKELEDISLEKVENISSTGTEEENTIKLQEVNTFLSHSVVDNSTVTTSNINSNKEDSLKSLTDNNEKDTKLLKEPKIVRQFSGNDTVKKDLMQSSQASVQKVESDMENISYHDDINSPTDKVPDQEEVFQCQNTEASSWIKDSQRQKAQLQQTDNVIETVGSFAAEDNSAEVEGSKNVERSEQEEKCVLVTQEVNTSQQSETFAAQEPAVDVSATMDSRSSGEEKTYSESVQEKSQQKKRKLGSTRRILLKRKQVGETDNKDNTEGENVEPLQDTVEQQDTDGVGTILSEESKLQNNASDQQSGKSNEIPIFLPEESSSEMNSSLSQLVPSSTETSTVIMPESSVSSCESSRNDGDGSVSVKVAEGQDTDEQKPGNMNEGTHNEDLEIKSASPDLNLTHGRRKMASTRRSLGSRAKGEILHQKQELDNDTTETLTFGEDATTESSSSFKEEQLQLQTEHKEVYSQQQNEKEAVEISHVDEDEESPVSQSPNVQTQHQLTPNYPPPSISPKTGVVSESASAGRKKKFGSNRKSRIPQSNKDQTQNERLIDSQNESYASGTTEEGAYKATEEHREGSPCLDIISEVDENDDNTSPSINISKGKELSKSESEKTPVQSQHAEISLVQESPTQLLFAGNTRGAELRSNSYDVVMIGDSYVGKTSFMKRAQSGKFSLDIPSSVGLDSCMWTVVVDGKPVLLQLWDTAGQERFRSITRQILHKAQAFLLMYDVTSTQSFSAVSFWANHIQENAAENVTVLLLGNKSDHAQRQVKTQQGESLAKDYNFDFMECSAATGENVIKALETVARMLSQRADLRAEATVLHKEPVQKKRSTCC